MRTTYNPVQGPFPTRPARPPGTTIVVGTPDGFSLLQASASPRLPAPASVAASVVDAGPKQLSDHVTVFGKEALKGYKKMFSDAQTTTFGRKWLGGKTQDFYLVDISRRPVSDIIIVPSKVSTLKFELDVQADVEVIDPLRAVEKGVTDVWVYFATVLQRWLGSIAADYLPTQLSNLTAKINSAVDVEVAKHDAFGTSIISVQRVSVTAGLDKVAQAYVREAEEADIKKEALDRRGEVEVRARKLQHAASQSTDELMAQWLQTKEPIYKEAMEMKIATLNQKDAQRVELMKLMLDKKMIADHDVHEKYPDLVERLFHQALPPAPASPDRLKITDDSGTEPG